LAAFIYLVKAKALASARTAQAAPDAGSKVGVLHGLPIVVKDNTHLAGMPNTAGTLAFKIFVPQDNNPDVQRLLDAVAIVVGNSGSDCRR
jgi:Asp-tRNA(Asn)/Glu-tRNA(Gln) amidotransferase A subunit family amidase